MTTIFLGWKLDNIFLAIKFLASDRKIRAELRDDDIPGDSEILCRPPRLFQLP